jgi:ADP-ribose pyrophosphatase YjhB (NUDIX family)
MVCGEMFAMKHNPKRELIARAIIIENDAVLVNQSSNKKTGEKYFALPGGHVDPGESCVQAVVRELEEELEALISVGDLRFVSESIYPGRKADEEQRHELVLYFDAALRQPLREISGRIHSPEKNKNFRWLPLRELPDANLLPRSAQQFLLKNAPAYAFDDTTQR